MPFFQAKGYGLHVKGSGPRFATLTVDDLTVLDDLTVVDDASVGGDLTVTGGAGITGNLSAQNLTAVADLLVGGDASITDDLLADVVSCTRVLAGDGTAAAPAYSYTNDTDTGDYRAGANDAAVSAGGTSRADFYASGFFATAIQTTGTFQADAIVRWTPRATVNLAAVGTQIPAGGGAPVPLTATGAIASTATPLFSGTPINGQIVALFNIDATDAITFSDNATIAGTLLALGAATRVLAAGRGYLVLQYLTADGLWHERAWG